MLRTIAEDRLLVPIGSAVLNFAGLIAVNEMGEFIWNELKEEMSLDRLLLRVCEEYEVEPDRAREDIIKFLDVLKSKNAILEESNR